MQRNSPDEQNAAPAGGRAGVFAWCLYDWGNSAFPAVVLTFVFAPYFTQAVAETPTLGTAQWGHAITISALLIAILSPVLGALSDKGGRRKPWLASCTVLAVLATALMWFVAPDAGWVPAALVLLVLANLGFELAIVFYNAMLPDLVPQARLGRVSGWGWGLGYAGGLACMGLAWFGLVSAEPPPFGLDAAAAEHVRATTVLAALWFALFTLPLFWAVPDSKSTGRPLRAVLREGLAEVGRTLRILRRYPSIAWFLIAHMVYIDGLNTLFAFGGIFAAGALGMEVIEVLEFGIALNVAAGLGALGFAWLDDWFGARPILFVSLAAMVVIGAFLLTTESKLVFWILGVLIGVFFGPVQSGSRSLMARLAPKALQTQMFGLFSLSGKATAFVGPVILAWVTLASDSQRLGMATVLVFLAAGALLLIPVREIRVD